MFLNERENLYREINFNSHFVVCVISTASVFDKINSSDISTYKATVNYRARKSKVLDLKKSLLSK